jgi:phage terminase large subunit-like protein
MAGTNRPPPPVIPPRAASSDEPPDDPVTEWAKAVVAGEIVVGPHIRNTCRRHLIDQEEGEKRGLLWDLAAAKRAINFFPLVLQLSQGDFDGAPFNLEPAQKFIIGSIFGWKKTNGKRRFRRIYIEIAKGSGKSPLAAGISLYCLVADGENQAQVFSAASMKPQARVVFDFAVRMWEQSPRLKAALTPTGKLTVQNLAHLASGSYFRPVSEDEGKLSGPMPSCAICDEVHEHRTDSIIRMLERGFKSRTQPLLIMITNSGSDRNSICWAEHQHAVKVAAGTMTPDADSTFVGEIIDDNEFSFVCGLDKDDDPLTDESCWIKANPLLGVTFPIEEMRRIVAQAKAIPGSLNLALRLHFCVWTDAETAWMSRPVLDGCLAHFDPEELAGSDMFIGIDLSATRDLTAMAFVVPTGTVEVKLDDGSVVERPTFDAWIQAWTPRDTMAQRAVKDQTPYDVWERQGFLHAEPGAYIATDFVASALAEYVGIFNVRAVAFDAYAFRKNFEPELDHLGLKLNLISHPQGGYRRNPESGLWMPGSKTELENLLLDRRIRLLKNPLLESSIMGAMVSSPDPVGNTYFSKQKATVRIDPLIALAMAVGAATGSVEKRKEYQILVF